MMENETPKPQDADRPIEIDVAEALQYLASAMVNLAREQNLLRETLAKIIEERKQLAELVTQLAAKVEILTKLSDAHGTALIRIGAIPRPAPKGDPLAN